MFLYQFFEFSDKIFAIDINGYDSSLSVKQIVLGDGFDT